MSARKMVVQSEDRAISMSTFLFSDNALPMRRSQPKNSAFIMRLKAIESNRLLKQGRRLKSAKKSATQTSLHEDQTLQEPKIGQPPKRESLNRLSIASILPPKHSVRETKRPSIKSYDGRVKQRPSSYHLNKRLISKQPLYGILVEEMAQYFNKHASHHRNKKLQIMKKTSLPTSGLQCFYKYLEDDPCIQTFDLTVAGKRPENKPQDLRTSNYHSASVNLEEFITQCRSIHERSRECSPRQILSASNGGGSQIFVKQVQTRKITATNVIDGVYLFGRPELFQGDELLHLRMLMYRDFLWKVAYSNMQVIDMGQKQKPKYFIGRGNNSKLLRTCMSRRWWWSRQLKQQNANLIWTQLKVLEVYSIQPRQKKQARELPACSYQLSDKDKKDPAGKLLNKQLFAAWRNHLIQNHQKQKKATGAFECRRYLLKNMNKITIESNSIITNHLEYSRFLGNKKALFFTMKQYYELSGEHYNSYMPLTFHVTGGLQDQEYLSFLAVYHQRKKQNLPNFWILKPGQMSNRGNGITVCDTLDMVKTIIKNKERHDNGKLKTYILQQYLASPFLYKNRKFDIRHYIMMTCINGVIKGYWYEEGYIRTTSYEYNLSQMNTQIHLTNDAVQKYCKDYGKYEKGNKISYKEFQTYLDQKYGNKTYDFQGLINTQIRKIATDALRAAYMTIDPHRRANNFQIFGMDFMIDSSFHPWLIEINTNPCLELSCPLLSKLIPAMVDNALRISLDPIYPPPISATLKKVYFQENRFQLVLDQLTDGEHLQTLYQNVKLIHEVLDNVGEDDEAYEDQDSEDEGE